MSKDLDSNHQQGHATAVAAAACAIKSLEESQTPVQGKTSPGPSKPFLSRLKGKIEDALPVQRKSSGGPESFMSRLNSNKEDAPPEPGSSLSRLKSRKEDTSPEPGRVSKRLSDVELPVTATKDEKAPEKPVDPLPSFKKTTNLADLTAKSERTTSKVTDPGPSMTKTPTFADERLNRTSSKKPEVDVPDFDRPATRHGRTESKSNISPPFKPVTMPTETKRQSSTRPGAYGAKADAWEKAKMAKIKERYEKLNEIITSWENRKKNKARRKLDETEGESETTRVKALQKYRSKIESIDQIVVGARAQALEKRRNEEYKAREKANIIKTTGKLPATCFCF